VKTILLKSAAPIAIACIWPWQSAFAQSAIDVLSFTAPAMMTVKPGDIAQTNLAVRIAPGYHANSNKPTDPYLIPLNLTWNPGPLEAIKVVFPQPQVQKLGFSAKPASVFTGDLDIVTRFRVVGNPSPGTSSVTGKLHYQACDDRSCLPPATIEVTVPVEIR
jgi:hypothetical protein